MAGDETDMDHDRRGLDRRVEMLEREVRQLETTTAVIQATLNGLVSTMDSRHKAFERGQDLILERLGKLQVTQQKHETDLASFISAPQDLSRATLSSRMVVSIVLVVAGIIGGQMASTWGIRSDVRDISTKQAQKSETSKVTEQLKDERAAMLKTTVDTISKDQKLQQLEIQSLRETILNQRRSQ